MRFRNDIGQTKSKIARFKIIPQETAQTDYEKQESGCEM